MFEGFRRADLAEKLVTRIKEKAKKHYKFMEVCGTHTVTMFRYGIRKVLAPNIELLSGPGCPVCVTDQRDIDWVIEFASRNQELVFTFGDMMRVPGSKQTLFSARENGGMVKIAYSPLDAVEFADKNRDETVLFFAVGFETTSPGIAASVKEAKKRGLKNLFVYSAMKLIPPALKVLADDPELALDGLILPGHVSTIIGSKSYEFLARDYKIPCVITGFEPIDVLMAIEALIDQIDKGEPSVEIQYSRVVRPDGNPKAIETLFEVFEPKDSVWRGLGTIEKSGLGLMDEYKEFDAQSKFHLKLPEPKPHKNCICGEVLKAKKKPEDCKLFARACTPDNPVGACMVSVEGTCLAHYRYGRERS